VGYAALLDVHVAHAFCLPDRLGHVKVPGGTRPQLILHAAQVLE
jgi:hypothetical protein